MIIISVSQEVVKMIIIRTPWSFVWRTNLFAIIINIYFIIQGLSCVFSFWNCLWENDESAEIDL